MDVYLRTRPESDRSPVQKLKKQSTRGCEPPGYFVVEFTDAKDAIARFTRGLTSPARQKKLAQSQVNVPPV